MKHGDAGRRQTQNTITSAKQCTFKAHNKFMEINWKLVTREVSRSLEVEDATNAFVSLPVASDALRKRLTSETCSTHKLMASADSKPQRQ